MVVVVLVVVMAAVVAVMITVTLCHSRFIVMHACLLVLAYVRSLRQGSLMMYFDALTELVPWFHALDHTHYASAPEEHGRTHYQTARRSQEIQ